MESLEVMRILGQGGVARYMCPSIQATFLCEDEKKEIVLIPGVCPHSVYLCRHRETNELVALKKIPRHRLQTPQQKRRAAAEQYLLANGNHPYLVRGRRTLEEAEFLSFEMDYLQDARPLYQCIWRYQSTARFPEHVAKYFAVQIVLAVAKIHALGYMHRDLKSGNILVDRHGIARVVDFGFARRVLSVQANQTGASGHHERSDHVEYPNYESERRMSLCGTHYVMAPELFRGLAYGQEVDWWGVGVIIFEMVIGKPPWDYHPMGGKPIDPYFAQVTTIAQSQLAVRLQVVTDASTTPISDECCSLITSLLTVNPEHRIGHGGASEVMAHQWFDDVDWNSHFSDEARTSSVECPYDPVADYNTNYSPTQRELVPSSGSSAESIDPDDNAKYFADF